MAKPIFPYRTNQYNISFRKIFNLLILYLIQQIALTSNSILLPAVIFDFPQKT